MGNSSVFCKGTGLFASNEYAYSIRTIGNTNAESHAYQDVPIHKAGNTYVLSGWAKANAVPDNIQKTTGTDAAATDKHKQFGLRAVLTYADGTTEYHYVPFHSDLTDWQYVSMTIVPKKEKEVLEKIRVVCAYERNSNEAWFDNLSLTQEAAQTMKYDKDGHLVSVKSTGKSEESTLYENGDLKKLNTGGNGTFTYEHDKNHNITEASNEIVKENLTYDASGNVTTATISPKKGTDKIVTNNTYTNQGNLLSSVKQRGEFTTTYQYETALHKMLGKPSQVVDARGSVASASYDAAGRLTKSSISKAGTTKATVNHSYIRDMLSQLSRTAGGITQQYNFSYDAFGNMTKLSVGNHTLAQYTYGPKNGQLKRQTYGNKDYVDFSYDNLNRITETRTSSGDSYRYTYTGDGQLYQMEDAADGVTYHYNYDTIGRLIGTSQTGGSSDLRAAYSYDDSNRLKSLSYSIPGVIDKATETLYYNSNTTDSVSDGALDKMALFSNNWIHYHYDNLSRLTERELGGILTEHRSYLAGKNGCTTTTLPKSFSTTPKGSTNKLSDYQYAYDPLGNIVQANDQVGKTYSKYAYDALGQMQYATDYLANGTAQKRYKYYYDSVGNLTSWKICSGDNTQTFESHTYTYGDADWKDLLTAFDGHSITYDGAGNPLNYYNGRPYSMTWHNGRQLDTVSVDGKTYQYEYDVNGLRTRKTNADGGYTEYYIVNGLTVAEQRFYPNGSTWYVMKYLLDEQNIPVGFVIWYPGTTYWTSYYYGKNLQGDVVNLYRSDPKGNSDVATLVATYRYDPWGKVQGIFKPNGEKIPETAVHIAAYNPFRYRGYRYDGDTGFYYLQSRYYDPAICRFISADEYSDTGDGMLGYNMFAYCLNDPVNRTDANGNWSLPNWAKVAIGAVAIVGLAVATVATGGTACAVAGALHGAVVGAMSGAASGAITGAIEHRITTGSWKGAGQAALDGAADGFMTGAIGGAIGGARSSSYCFIAGTAVLTAAGAVTIENIQPGDMVWAWNEETGETELKPVVETYVNETDELIHVFVEGEEIICTPSHPFYSPVKGWTDACKLRAGDILVLVNGEYVVVEKIQHELLENPVKVYNFQVEDDHTYYVSHAGVLVHNKCGDKPENKAPNNAGGRGAFRQAKRDVGIPVSQQPRKVLPNVDRRGRIQPGRVYDFGNGVSIRNDVADHLFPDGTFLGPHFNGRKGWHYFYN